MNVKAASGLLLGLVFQLAQVLPAALIAAPCQTAVEQSCACCKAGKSCHCVENNESHQKPAPVVPDAGTTLKVPLARASETLISLDAWAEPQPSTTAAACPLVAQPDAYPGVRLSVAFCSFVI